MLALIGLGSVSRPLVDELVADGRMPALASLRERGTDVTLETPAAHLAAATFTSLWTGAEPEEHGRYYPFLWDAAGQRVVSARRRPVPRAFWELAADAGARVLALDPYEAPRPTSLAGMCVSGWQLRNRVVLERWDNPPGAAKEWERRLGAGPAGEEVFGRPSERRLRALRRVLLDAPARVASLVELAVPQVRPDVLVLDLAALHLAGHQLWDPRAALGGVAVHPELETGLRDVYAAGDAALGRIVAALPEGAGVIVVSSIGMGANTSRSDLLPRMLDAVLGHGSGGSDSGGRIRRLAPTGLRSAVARALPASLAVDLTARLELRGTDWRSTRAFVVPSDVEGLIRVNLAGREREGIVSPEERDGLLEEIAAGLRTFVHPDGLPAVASIERRDDVFPPGPSREGLPDLIVHWADRPTALSERVESPAFGAVHREGAGSGRSGNHRPDAWALVVPGASRLAAPSERPFRVTDVAATACARFGPAGEGRSLLEPA